MKALGGIAPFGYRWRNGELVIDETEAPVRKLIYELFLKHRRKKTVAKLMNDLGHRTRSASFFSDTTIDRLLRDTTAKGTRLADGKEVEVEPIISVEIWERVNNILAGNRLSKRASELFTGIAYCGCGGKMIVPSNIPKYACMDCRRKILKDDLEAIFRSQLKNFVEPETGNLYEYWEHFTRKEKRILIELICERIVIERDTITIRFGFGYSPHLFKSVTYGQQIERGNETPETNTQETKIASMDEPLLSEAEAAKFLGVSKMTVLRRRNAGEIGYFKIGNRVLYSKEKHLIPYLGQCERSS